ncbi:MAG TPA: methyl-accepting chemotaxis protein [Burkholderiaceae bacterium]|nr:methyl-accepting chemotaxis protein [Burkholderiaceae bacterium]HNB43833.1 methyl-accepting chemotaxis protein [Burkholderiaceae bacterium]HNG79725.1 methyl-accepting chemotaxis protein [Burkholderiaceae bacterium]
MNFLKDLKIGTRLALGFGLLLGLMALMAALAAVMVARNSENAHFYAGNLVPSYQVQKEMFVALSSMRQAEWHHVSANDLAKMDSLEAQMAVQRKVVEAAVDRYGRQLLADDEDRQLMQAFASATKAYYAAWDTVRTLSRASAQDRAMTDQAEMVMMTGSQQAFEQAHAALDRWWSYNVRLSDLRAKETEVSYQQAMMALGAGMLVALVIGVTSAWTTTRSITQPMQRAHALAERVADGDLSVDIAVDSRDEVGQLLAALRSMSQRLAGVVSTVRLTSDSIATGSTQVASGNADLSQRTEEQASALEQTAATMEELGATVRQNSENAQQANGLAQGAAQIAAKGGSVVGQVVATMKDIEASSKKISEIIGVIDGIAFQTNILALNAAVEAARAGEQGRGFAVVAGEVRNLAQRSADAAKEIKSLITASVERVERGGALADEAGSTMDEIVDAIGRVTTLMSEITSATVEQSSGIQQVGDAISQLDQVTQQNAALVEESAAAAESLKQQAGGLVHAVGVFRLPA